MPKHTDQQLYSTNGQPALEDTRQDRIFNCYFVSSMGAVAMQQPDRIRDAIRYESDPANPSEGMFYVALHHPTRGRVEVPVTQADIDDNIQRKGGGTADNKKGSPIWPSVMETAFAKLHDPDPNNNSLDDAYRLIGSETRGGSLHDAMFALTGEQGHNLRYSHSPKGSSAPPGNTGEKPSFYVPLTNGNVSRFDDASGAYSSISQALAEGKSVTVSTRNADVNDGLMKHHAYVVTDIELRDKKDGSNEVRITLRNPYAHNNNTPSESKDTSKPSITVSFDKMLEKNVFGEINIGPAPRIQTQQQDAAQPAHDPRSPEHPDHKLYAQIEAGVKRIDAEKGREFDSASERLTLAAFRDAKAAGITSADHIELNHAGKPQPDGSQIAAGTSLFVVQGKDPSDPLASRSTTDVKQAIDQPVEHHLQKIEQLQQQQAQTQTQGQVVDNPTQADIAPKGPKL